MSIYNITDFDVLTQDLSVNKKDKLEYGEIYTSFSFINQMLNLFDASVFTDPHKTWLDIGAGKGYFTILLFNRLNIGLTNIIPNELERKTHIVENMLFMIEIKESNCVELKNMFGEKANIIQSDFCCYDDNLLYDYIIGNPPYNSHGIKKVPTNKGMDKKQDGKTSWTNFVIKSLALLKPTTGKLCLIIPLIWLKPDKCNIHGLLTQYKIEKIHCFSSNETNSIFRGEAQTPTCFFILTKIPTDHIITLYDRKRQNYVEFTHFIGKPIPVFGSHIIQKMHKWLTKTGSLKVEKTNMPSIKSKLIENPYDKTYPYVNISSCILEGVQPTLLINYSNIPQAFYGVKKLVLAHKMYGFPYIDNNGAYGISNRDNYVIINKTDNELQKLQLFLSTNFALYLFEGGRYRMKYLEKYAFEFIPDITKLDDFPLEITDETVADYFGLDKEDQKHISGLHKKKYKRFL